MRAPTSPRSAIGRLRAAALLVLILAPLAWAAKDVQFDQAESLRNKRKPAEAIPLYEAVIARPKVSAEDKARSQWGIVECLRQLKKYDEALAIARRLHESLAPENWMRRQAAQAMCDLLAQLDRLEEAAALAAKSADEAADERDVAADWRLRCVYFLQKAKKYSEAYEQAQKAVDAAREGEDHRRVLDALWAQSDAMYAAQDYPKCLVPLKRSLELKYDDLPPASWLRFKQRIAECYSKMEQRDELRSAFKSFIAVEADPVQRQRWWISIARTYETEKNAPRAIEAYEQVLVDHAESACRDLWPEAQSSISRLSLADASPEDSLKILHLTFDLADTRERIQSAAMQILAMIRKIDGNPARARAFAAFQQGRAGPDGKLGTADDLADPMESVGYPSNPARIAAFEAASAKLGCDAQAALHRGWMCLYIGRPKEAARWFIDAARRGSGDEYQAAIHALVFCAGRASTGSIADVEAMADYILHGPGGADGKQELADPFAQHDAREPAADVKMKAAPLSAKDRTTLVEVEKRLGSGFEQGMWQPDMRLDAIASLERVHGALRDWDSPGLADWYLARLKSEPAGKTQEAFVPGALAAARGSQIHLAGVKKMLAQLEGEGGRPIVRETVRKAWTNWMQRLESGSRSKTLVPRMKVN